MQDKKKKGNEEVKTRKSKATVEAFYQIRNIAITIERKANQVRRSRNQAMQSYRKGINKNRKGGIILHSVKHKRKKVQKNREVAIKPSKATVEMNCHFIDHKRKYVQGNEKVATK